MAHAPKVTILKVLLLQNRIRESKLLLDASSSQWIFGRDIIQLDISPKLGTNHVSCHLHTYQSPQGIFYKRWNITLILTYCSPRCRQRPGRKYFILHDQGLSQKYIYPRKPRSLQKKHILYHQIAKVVKKKKKKCPKKSQKLQEKPLFYQTSIKFDLHFTQALTILHNHLL